MIIQRSQSEIIFLTKADENPELEGDTVLLPPSVQVASNVVMKLPVFWPDTAEVWFAQADSQFPIKTITVSKTKKVLSCSC